MNGRVYDPCLARFLQVDNFVQNDRNTQNLNRYSYVLNNPLTFSDPSGELFVEMAIFAGVQLGADLIRSKGNMNIGEMGISVLKGAAQGALASFGADGGMGAWEALGNALLDQVPMPQASFGDGNFTLGISPSLSIGSNGMRVGINAVGTIRMANTSISLYANAGFNPSMSDLSGLLTESKYSLIHGFTVAQTFGTSTLAYSQTYFGGHSEQMLHTLAFSSVDSHGNTWGISTDNDLPYMDGFRTASLAISVTNRSGYTATAGFSLWTGIDNGLTEDGKSYDSELETPGPIRNGNAFGGLGYNGRTYLAGWNSEAIRAFIQNNWHDFMGWDPWFVPWNGGIMGGASPHFEKKEYDDQFYWHTHSNYLPTIYKR
jgi:hypothetical protein